MHVYEEIDGGAGRDFVLKMREKGVIRDPATFVKAMDRVAAVKKATGDGGVFTSPTYKDTVKFITNETGYGDLASDGLRGLSSEGMEALYDYRNMLLEWDMKNPEASLMEKEKAAREAGDLIRSRFREVTDPKAIEDGVRAQYQSEADEAKPQPQELQELLPEPEPEAPAQEEEGGYLPQPIRDAWDWLTGGDEEEAEQPTEQSSAVGAIPFDTLSDSTKRAVEAFAKKKGLSVEEAYGIISGRAQKLSGETSPGVDPTTTNSISTETRDKLSSLLQDPPKVERLTASNVPVGPLLSLIGHTEGTDRGDGYNETLGYGAYTGGDVNLTGMTLGEIDKLQTQMLRHPDNRWNSSAIGRYQIIRTTLRKLKSQMGLGDDVLFTPELQDRMAMQLLEGRGLSKWQAGKMTDEQFMAGLSAEWASLPKADGRGTYKGQRVGTSTWGLRGILDKVRGA